MPAPTDQRAVLMGGDFNCVLDIIDCAGHGQRRAQRAAEAGSRALAALMAAAQPAPLVDVWRQHHPQAQDVTYFTHSAARLDRWLVADTLLPCCTSSSIQDLRPVNTDHLPVTVTIQPAGLPLLGKGLGGVC
jgi:exonuclease III